MELGSQSIFQCKIIFSILLSKYEGRGYGYGIAFPENKAIF